MHLFDICCLIWVKFDVRDNARNSVGPFVSIVKISTEKVILFEWMRMKLHFLDFKLSPCSEWCMLSSG